MTTHSTAPVQTTFTRDPTDPTVAVVDGYAAHIAIERGGLFILDGVGPARRERRYGKVTHRLRRIVVLGNASITTQALAWCQTLGVAVIVLDPTSKATVASTAGAADDARLRRQQAAAPDRPGGVRIGRLLLGACLDGRTRLARDMLGRPEVADTLQALAADLDTASTLDQMRGVEATAAACWWSGWTHNPSTGLHYAARDARAIPPHWRTFATRRSQLGAANSNRRAERPVNAVLNYLYALAEAETRIACLAVGLDPGLGIIHMDAPGRDSMVLDMLEAIRPTAEAHALHLAATRTWRRTDFHEAPDGRVRLRPPATHDLAPATDMLAREIAPYAEAVAAIVAEDVPTKINVPTRLTGSRRRSAQAGVNARKNRATAAPARPARRSGGQPSSAWTCPECGGPVANHRHVRCAACIDADPQQTTELRGRRGKAIAARIAAQHAWERATGEPYAADCWQAIRVSLACVPLSAIVAATGVSKSTASSWRVGHTTPHPCHWPDLATLGHDAARGRSMEGIR